MGGKKLFQQLSEGGEKKREREKMKKKGKKQKTKQKIKMFPTGFEPSAPMHCLPECQCCTLPLHYRAF
jgi:hypothetical protein